MDEPWEGDEVVKVGDKIFVFLGARDADPPGMSVKCGRTAEDAREPRDRFPSAVTTSAYVGRYGWNSVRVDGTLPDDDVLELVDASYDAVVQSLPKSKRPVTSSGSARTPGRSCPSP